ncbi:MAG: amino acid ABC transporter substrate-binding protein [Betaproteobacteria bacterium]|jgi:ABC-type amino acid transport substrate-binding protein|nr:amino acid ABC transporter substrate-binding protein [Betaproteobacteria bacterium]
MIRLLALFLFLCSLPAHAQALTGTLKKIRDTGVVNLGFRETSPPFSSMGAERRPIGYSVDLCTHVVGAVQKQLALPTLKINWVAVTAANRIDQVASGAVDLECGTTTITLSRMERVDFSSMIFIDGASMLVRADSGMRRMADVVGKRVAVVSGTTSEAKLRDAMQREQVKVTLVPFQSEPAALGALRESKVDAYANDRLLLVGLAQAEGAEKLTLLEEDFSVEPYALMMRRNDADFRLAVNRALAHLYRSVELTDVYDKWFGQYGRPSSILQSAYLFGAYQE